MKRYFLLLIVLIAGLSACQKIQSDTVAKSQAVVDDEKIQDYISANKITATKDPATGVYYNIINPGAAPFPTALSSVKLTYTNSYLNGLEIGVTSGVQAKLTSFLAGLQVGILKIGTGGRILLIIPSGQAYGTGETNGIPGNSVLVYTLDLDGVTAN